MERVPLDMDMDATLPACAPCMHVAATKQCTVQQVLLVDCVLVAAKAQAKKKAPCMHLPKDIEGFQGTRHAP